MKRPLSIFVLSLSLLGCRREDVRTLTVTMPGLQVAQTNKIAAALSPYAGIKKDSFRWDFARNSLTLAYDSMQIAGANIRMAIEGAGIKVDWPMNTTGRAGH